MISPFKGRKHTVEANEKNRLAHLGRKYPYLQKRIKLNCLRCQKEFERTPSVIHNKKNKGGGKYCSASCKMQYLWSQKDYKEMQSSAHKGQMPTNVQQLIEYSRSDEGRASVSLRFKGKPSPRGMLGKKHTEETRQKQRMAHLGTKKPWALRGELHYKWIKDRTQLANSRNLRGDSNESIIWARNVKKRDGWKCKMSNQDCTSKLEAHHILVYRDFPELRYEINNGITLCKYHHPRKREEEKRLVPFFQGLLINQSRV